MATDSVNFSSGTVVSSAWLNAIDASTFDDVINVKRYGAVGNGTTDDTVAIQAAITAAKLLVSPELVIPSGEYYVTDTLTFDLPDNSTIRFVGTIKAAVSNKPAIVIGKSSANASFYTVLGLKVYRSSGTDTTGTSTGVKLLNLIAAHVSIQEVYFFRYGVTAVGDGFGFSYNNIFLGAIRDNRDNLTLTSANSGYCNECNWFGGTFNHSSSYSTAVTTTHIKLDNVSPAIGNHRFYGPSFEESTNSTLNTAAIINGDQNVIFWPRMEHDYYQSTYLIQFTANATGCGLIGGGFGVNAENISDLGAVTSWDAYDQTSVKCSTPNTAGKGVIRARSTSTSSARVLLVEDATGVETTSIRGDGSVYVPTLNSYHVSAGSTSYANDAAAAAGGIAVGGFYRNGSVVQVRVV